MYEYPKIQTMFKRAQDKSKRIIMGDWTCPEFSLLQVIDWNFTEKVDGTNIRIMIDPVQRTVAVGGRTDNAQIFAPLYEVLHALFLTDARKEKLFEVFDRHTVLYGEGYGRKIQSVGGLYLPDSNNFALFDVLVEGRWLERENVSGVADELSIKKVPDIGWGTLWDAINFVRRGVPSSLGSLEAEGIVARPHVTLLNRFGARIITKIKSRDFRELDNE